MNIEDIDEMKGLLYNMSASDNEQIGKEAA
jgi:hypothetical protein